MSVSRGMTTFAASLLRCGMKIFNNFTFNPLKDTLSRLAVAPAFAVIVGVAVSALVFS